MSLFASLVLAVMSQFWSKERDTLPALFITQAAVYFVMSFCLWGFSNLHPLGILMNLALGPLIGGVIFPLALLIVFVPPASFLFDFAMNALTWILRQSSELLSERATGVSFSIVSQWLMFAILLTGSYIYIVWAKRQKARRV